MARHFRPSADIHYRLLKIGGALAPLLFWLCFFLSPLVLLFSRFLALAPDLSFLSGPSLLRAAKIFNFTFWQAQLSALGAVAPAFVLASILGRFDFRGRSLILKMAIIPYILPGVAVAAIFRASGASLFLGDSGLGPIVAAHIYYNFPIALIILTMSRERQNPQYIEAAKSLGASFWPRFWQISRPLASQGLYSAWLLVFFMCFLSFGAPFILGDQKTMTLEVAIYRAALYEMNFSQAAFLGLLELAPAVILFALLKKISFPSDDCFQPLPPAREAREKMFLYSALGLALTFMFVPVILLVASSFKNPEGGFSLAYWQSLFAPAAGVFDPQLGPAASRSLKTAFLTAVISTGLAFLGNLSILKLKGFLRTLLTFLYSLPWLFSAVVMGLALFMFYLNWPVSFQKSALALALIHSLAAWPILSRFLWPTISQWPQTSLEAARTLGAGPWASFRSVILPWLAGPLLTALALSAMISLGEFGASLFLARGPEEQTLTTVMGHYLSLGGALNYGRAMALASMMALLMFALAFFIAFLEKAFDFKLKPGV